MVIYTLSSTFEARIIRKLPPTANESQPTGLGGTGMLRHTCAGHT